MQPVWAYVTLAGAAIPHVNPRSGVRVVNTVRIALLHLAPVPGDLIENRRLIERGIAVAARAGAAWIITPELCVCGYTFTDTIGTDWIMPQPRPMGEPNLSDGSPFACRRISVTSGTGFSVQCPV